MPEAPVLHLIAPFFARLADLAQAFAARPDPIAVPVRRDDRRGPHRPGRQG